MDKRLFADRSNVVFVDTKFSSLDPRVGEIVSIGMVKPDRSELYVELEYDGAYSSWFERRVLPQLNQVKVPRGQARQMVIDFIGPEKPRPVFLLSQYDTVYFGKMFPLGSSPMDWPPIDLASVMFSLGMKPDSFIKDYGHYREFGAAIGINPDNYQDYDALSCARLSRDIYYKLIKKRYHTHEELLAHRYQLFICLCHLVSQKKANCVWRSQKHFDPNDPMFPSSFVMGVNQKKGEQMTYHLPMSLWEKTFFAEDLERAPEYDGHNSEDVLTRLEKFVASL